MVVEERIWPSSYIRTLKGLLVMHINKRGAGGECMRPCIYIIMLYIPQGGGGHVHAIPEAMIILIFPTLHY